ncbi:AT-rich interactive domain-containing protein 3A [Polypterus senegalus]|uniref:AT-rich interactive domain-containing protein 3A n=1 Tax=Polypterus senegalus TaxID=55291 RepID=UPI001966A753|nr:AT-rich interactive domain-containing protein 3A [Polypterus senegalus]XP_039623124.1 AT-rich interactive domain-containing protein 3A [Polypterus senegalus]XP_039623125.1 AT-rich interactive domain-containing protein 3A [Polypterus senegalus]
MAMKLQAVMENLHRQQRAKLQMELEQQQQQQLASHSQAPLTSASNSRKEDSTESKASKSFRQEDVAAEQAPGLQRTQMAALAAMRAAAAGLQRHSDSSLSENGSTVPEEEEDEEEDDEEEGAERYKEMMGSDEEEHIKRKWDEEDFEEEMEDDFDDLDEEEDGEESRAIGDATVGGKTLAHPHRPVQAHSQFLKMKTPVGQDLRIASLPGQGSHSQAVGQDHGDWTYEEQFKQLYELDADPKRKEFLDDLFSFMQKRGTPVNRIPIMAKQVLDLYMLYMLVTEKGGLVEVINKKLWREITKGLNLPTSITSAAFTLRTQYMKYLYPYECDKRGLSNPNELQAAIDSNRREGRRQGFGGTLFTYSPNGTPTMLSSPKLALPSMNVAVVTNGGSLNPIPKIKTEDDGGPVSVSSRMPVALPGHSMVAAQAAAVQAAAAQAAMAAQVAALEQLRDKLDAGEPPEKKMVLMADEQQRIMQRALQQNLLAMSTQIPMNIRINNQESRGESSMSLSSGGLNSINMSVELNGVVYTGVLFAQAAGASSSTPSAPSNSKASGGRSAPSSGLPVSHTSTSSSSCTSNPSP